MVPQLRVEQLREGLPVEFLGEEADARGLLSEALLSRGMALYPGHPGRVWNLSLSPQHVQVSWVGLEEEPASYAFGFGADSLLPGGRFRGLGLLAEAEYVRREKAMMDRLAGDDDLTGWVAPWRDRPDVHP